MRDRAFEFSDTVFKFLEDEVKAGKEKPVNKQTGLVSDFKQGLIPMMSCAVVSNENECKTEMSYSEVLMAKWPSIETRLNYPDQKGFCDLFGRTFLQLLIWT